MSERISYFQRYFNRLLTVTNENELYILEYNECRNQTNLDDINAVNTVMQAEFPEVTILGGESIGVVVKSEMYPDIIAKYICDNIRTDYFKDKITPIEFEMIGHFNYPNGNSVYKDTPYNLNGNRNNSLPQHLLEMLVPTFEVSDCGHIFINKYYPGIKPVFTYTKESIGPRVIYDKPLTEGLLKNYAEIMKRGYFLLDCHTSNFTYDSHTGRLMLVDLDGLCYCPNLCEQIAKIGCEELGRFMGHLVGIFNHREISDNLLPIFLSYLTADSTQEYKITSDIWS